MGPSLAVFMLVLHAARAEYRQPPGVNPAHYQAQGQVPQQQFQQPPQQQFQQPPQQQFQQPPQQQFQQPPPQQGVPQQQFQQVPQQQAVPQQQFQQAPQQGQPVQQGIPQQQFQRTQGGHGGQQQAILRDKQKIQAEKEHIKEHLGAPIDTAGMSEEELQFHYFKMHDADGNNKLDGLELVASLQHWHDEDHSDGEHAARPPPPAYPEWKVVEMVDLTLLDSDADRDGYVSWAEFLTTSSRM
ncbi:putative mediator of RNA polymerase II transcription subunit 29 isoform X3 [Pollicipes pollicipes]|uniref:putative mediator of RNA polymerase II transcription subunit 29 isoform X3 n=1 Tax=Pollicipes pollicipes TaxID=41117 RepID=UPI001885925F|nr:putative mediator of RNA polymerase II transcription subunit 29 isoform X3 [Pollicipes pollicipes]